MLLSFACADGSFHRLIPWYRVSGEMQFKEMQKGEVMIFTFLLLFGGTMREVRVNVVGLMI